MRANAALICNESTNYEKKTFLYIITLSAIRYITNVFVVFFVTIYILNENRDQGYRTDAFVLFTNILTTMFFCLLRRRLLCRVCSYCLLEDRYIKYLFKQ